jgi:hypothetical protein
MPVFGNPVEVEVRPSDAVGDIKEVVCQFFKVDSARVMLVHDGKPLDDSNTVADVGLKEYSNLQLVLIP